MAYQELTHQSIEIHKQLRDRGKAVHCPAGNTEEAIIDHLREIKTELIGHGVTTEIGMILRGCTLAQESDNPFDHPMTDHKIDETYFDWLQEFRNRDRRLQITPLNCMATILYEQPNLSKHSFDDVVQVFTVATDLASTLREYYKDDPNKILPKEFQV